MQLALWWGVRRALVYLKRMSETSQRSAEALETLARIEQDRWEKVFAPRPRGKFVIGQMDVAAVNARWKEMNKSEFDVDAKS